MSNTSGSLFRIGAFPPLATQVRDAEFYDADAKLDAAGEGTVTCTAAALPAPVTAALHSAARNRA